MVHITRVAKRKVFEYLLNEGVIVIKKDLTFNKHSELEIENLFVWMLLRSLKDKDLVEVVFSWQYYYYYLKNEGVKFLRDQLGIVEEIVPTTFKKVDNKKYEEREEGEEGQRPRRNRENNREGGKGGRSFGRGRDRKTDQQEEQPKEEATAQQ